MNRPHAKIRAPLSKDEEHLIESTGLGGLAINKHYADTRLSQEMRLFPDFPMKLTLLQIVALTVSLFAQMQAADSIRVLVWDEQQPQQKEAYGEKFLGESIAAHLEKQAGFSVKSARLDDPDQGLSETALDATDVLVFWCHRRVNDQDDARMESVVRRVLDGKLAFIALHSAHWAKPFVRLMQERSKADALAGIPEPERSSLKWEFLNEKPYYKGVKADARLTPFLTRTGDVCQLTLPQCVFPVYRNDGALQMLFLLLDYVF